MDFLKANGSELLFKTGEHFYISAMALVLGVLIAVPLGIALTRFKTLFRFYHQFCFDSTNCPFSGFACLDDSLVRNRKASRDCSLVHLFTLADSEKYVHRHLKCEQHNR